MPGCLTRGVCVQVTFRGDGPIGSVMAIADTRGNVKGKVGFQIINAIN